MADESRVPRGARACWSTAPGDEVAFLPCASDLVGIGGTGTSVAASRGMGLPLAFRSALAASGLSLAATLVSVPPSGGDPVPVRFQEGLVHGFLALRTLDGRTLADGELLQVSRGSRVTSRLVFRFRDGSTSEETVTFDQRGRFRLLRDRLVQKGPAFPAPMDLSIDTGKRKVVVRTQEDGEEKVYDESMDLPPDLANGLMLTLLKNLDAQAGETTVSFVAATPKPRLVKLVFRRMAEEPFVTGGLERRAAHYLVKVDVPGLTGVVARILDKEPPDSHVWVLGGDAPAFIRSESPMYVGGPLWRIDLVSPSWPKATETRPAKSAP